MYFAIFVIPSMQHFHKISILYSFEFIAKSAESLWLTFLSEINENDNSN